MCSDFDPWAVAAVDSEWQQDHEERWRAFARTGSPEAFAAARRSATRAAALLGAFPDGLRLEDHTLTRVVAHERKGWRAGLERRRAGLPAAFALQLGTYRVVELRAIAGTPPDEDFVKRLHQLVCGGQTTYLVSNGGRLAREELPRGRYKRLANHSRSGRGCPRYVDVDAVDDAMPRFVAELGGDAFASAHPAVQAAYVLHTLLVIHPFADGNGRVSRALASIYLLRALSLPFFVESHGRGPYLEALRCADAGEVQPLIGFVARQCAETMCFALDRTVDLRVHHTLDTGKGRSYGPDCGGNAGPSSG
jgi:hypothetical protein